MRIAKYLAHAGIASRRQAEALIAQGRVKLNGSVVTDMAISVESPVDLVEFDDKPVLPEKPVYIMLYKPAGYICTVDDPQGRATVLELVRAVKERIYPVGRLDYDTEGLLLLTNDGQFTNRIIHPRYKIDKKYLVWVQGLLNSHELNLLRNGVQLEDGITAPAAVNLLKGDKRTSVIELIIHEGRKRQVKRMCNAVGHRVVRLQRTALEFLTLDGLQPGDFRYLQQDEVNRLQAIAMQEKY
ncbi:MAG: pseudouridine synthase [Syntrophomonadaceae bacterium]|nr:pseudouridine synthase [Syntrophomonadaceae bacterium]